MADRQKFCIIIMSVLLLVSAGYLGYYLFICPEHAAIQKFNLLRLYIFFGQHMATLLMFFRLVNFEENDHVVKWMFQLSTFVLLTFVGGEIFVIARGGRLFGTSLKDYGSISSHSGAILEFQINEITLYYQIMLDFVMFFFVSGIAIIVLKCRDVDSEVRYEFMIENLKSEDFVDEPNCGEKKSCAICLTDLESERVLKLPCEHVFHKECLVGWLKRSTVCPLCRTDIEESLAPGSPQRYPPFPINSQPIILPPPQSLPQPIQNRPVSNPTINMHARIPSSNGDRHLNNHLNDFEQNVEEFSQNNNRLHLFGNNNYLNQIQQRSQQLEDEHKQNKDRQQSEAQIEQDRPTLTFHNEHNPISNFSNQEQRNQQIPLSSRLQNRHHPPPLIVTSLNNVNGSIPNTVISHHATNTRGPISLGTRKQQMRVNNFANFSNETQLLPLNRSRVQKQRQQNEKEKPAQFMNALLSKRQKNQSGNNQSTLGQTNMNANNHHKSGHGTIFESPSQFILQKQSYNRPNQRGFQHNEHQAPVLNALTRPSLNYNSLSHQKSPQIQHQIKYSNPNENISDQLTMIRNHDSRFNVSQSTMMRDQIVN